jgi:hypothetical protein
MLCKRREKKVQSQWLHLIDNVTLTLQVKKSIGKRIKLAVCRKNSAENSKMRLNIHPPEQLPH